MPDSVSASAATHGSRATTITRSPSTSSVSARICTGRAPIRSITVPPGPTTRKPTSGGTPSSRPTVLEVEAAHVVEVDDVERQHQTGAEELEDDDGQQQPALAGQVVPERRQAGALV